MDGTLIIIFVMLTCCLLNEKIVMLVWNTIKFDCKYMISLLKNAFCHIGAEIARVGRFFWQYVRSRKFEKPKRRTLRSRVSSMITGS
jgi:hypothetical protein